MTSRTLILSLCAMLLNAPPQLAADKFPESPGQHFYRANRQLSRGDSQNEPPVITGHNPIEIYEGTSADIRLSDLSVVDPDNAYPEGFTLTLFPGTNYTVSGSTVTPDNEYSGTLMVPITVNDGTAESSPFSVAIGVIPVNDAPVITGQLVVQTSEEQPIELTLAQLSVADPDNAWPGDFTLTVSSGTNYATAGNTIIPENDFTGTLSVPVTVHDGEDPSPVFAMNVEVVSADDPPVITGQVTLEVPEEQVLTIEPGHLIVSDPDSNYPEGFTLTVYEGTGYSLSGTSITPVADLTGTLTVPVSVNDGTASSEIFNLQVTVTPVNDAPVISGQTPLSTGEDQPITVGLEHLSVGDPDNVYPTDFTLSVLPGDNYTASGTTVTPAAGFNGTLSVPVTVSDGISTSNVFGVQIAVTAANNPPVITGQTSAAVAEDTPFTIQFEHLAVTDADNSYPQGFTMTVGVGASYTVTGTTVTPEANFTGTLLIPVSVNDGSSSSNTFEFRLDVTPVNDPPVITGQGPIATEEETAVTLALTDFVVTDPDNAYPSGFSLTVHEGPNYTVSGNTITPGADFSGALTVGVSVSDGLAMSAVFNATVNVGGSNDAPVITGQTELQTNEEQPLAIALSHLTVSDSDNTYPTGFTLSVMPNTGYTVSGTTITPAKDFTGTLVVPVTVNDGESSSNIFNLQVTVVNINDAPVVTGQKALQTFRNEAITLQMGDLQVVDPDNTYPQGFSLNIGVGQNYTVFGYTVTPQTNFTGTLSVPVTVNDGIANSPAFIVKIDVIAPPNVPPVITGQVTLTTYENQPLDLRLSHLIVSDPDNVFPQDFTMTIFPGAHYTISNGMVVPERDYSGMLSVKVTVSDQKANSDPFLVQIEVLPVSDVPLITSQAFLRMNEDDSLTLKASDLIVLDPDDNYPEGFTISIQQGTNYTFRDLLIIPSADFNGYLTVPVTVNDGENNSAPYQLIVLVDPVNDPPVITDNKPGSYLVGSGGTLAPVFADILIEDVDDDSLSFAEVAIVPFEPGSDSLTYPENENIRAIFDDPTGTLVIFGNASIASYNEFIRGIEYGYRGTPAEAGTKALVLRVNDGTSFSESFTKDISLGEAGVALDIPSGFTPNGDGRNDTWTIRAVDGNGFPEAVIRIYNKRGTLVFEGRGLDAEWDGTMNGALLPADSYFYTIDLRGAASRNRYKGIITILH